MDNKCLSEIKQVRVKGSRVVNKIDLVLIVSLHWREKSWLGGADVLPYEHLRTPVVLIDLEDVLSR